MQEERKRVLRGCICAGLGGVVWGFSGTCGQYLFAHWPVSSLWLTCVRLLSAGAILLVMALVQDAGEVRRLLHSPRDLALTALYGVGGLMLCQYAYMTGISHSNAATTTVLQNLSIITVMLLTCLQLRRRPNRKEVIALVLALLGVFLIATGGSLTQLVMTRTALLWGFTTTLCATAYTLLPRPLLKRWPQVPIIACGMLLGGIVLNVTAQSWTFELHLAPSGWLAIAAIVFIGTIASFTLFLQGLKDFGPVKTSMLVVTEPVSATIFSALWLHTAFSAAELLGFAAILATIFLLAKE